MGTNQIFLIILIVVFLGFIVPALVMAKLIHHDERFYDKRWKIYNLEKEEEKGKK